jgi:hypothetical protein
MSRVTRVVSGFYGTHVVWCIKHNYPDFCTRKFMCNVNPMRSLPTFVSMSALQTRPPFSYSRGIEVCSIYADRQTLPETGSAQTLNTTPITKLVLVAPPYLRNISLKGFCERRLVAENVIRKPTVKWAGKKKVGLPKTKVSGHTLPEAIRPTSMITTLSVPKSMGVEVAIHFFSFKQPDSARPRIQSTKRGHVARRYRMLKEIPFCHRSRAVSQLDPHFFDTKR